MRFTDGRFVLSPSDLMRFQSCEHASALDLRYARGEKLTPAEDGDDAALLQKKGHEHEANYLGTLAPEEVATIERSPDFSEAVGHTVSAMRAGVRVIYQGALETGMWQGWSDFLERVDTPSQLGSWSYEVVDTKLKRRADPKHALQLAIYSRAVAELQGHEPLRAHVVIGTGKRVPIVLDDVRDYVDRLAERLEQFVERPWETKPEPVSACGLCRWRDLCDAHYKSTDSLVRVAGISRSQRSKLEDAGITTAHALATSEGRVPRMQVETSEKLRTQARLQVARRAGSGPKIKIKALEAGRGFARLPRPSKGDLFFDMEGDPLIDGGLEYLFGVYFEDASSGRFRAWWSHTAEDERRATEAVLEFFVKRVTDDPNAHIYHYNHYEVTALKKLTQRYGVGEAAFDHLLRNQKFVDLYRVVQQGLIGSEDGYSLKDLEVFYMGERDGAVATAADSIIAYETWLETRDQKILDDIERYNEVDCRSTKGLRDWLVSVRPQDAVWFEAAKAEKAPELPVDAAREVLKARLRDVAGRVGPDVADVLLELNAFHARADKPSWWEFFDRQGRDVDELIEDLECLGGLEAVGPLADLVRTYKFPHQETKIRRGARVAIPNVAGAITIEELDPRRRIVRVKSSRRIGPLPDKLNLIPGGPLDNNVLREAVGRITASLIKGDGQFSAILDFLMRKPPKFKGRGAGAPVCAGEDLLAETIAAAVALDSSYLPIQGPPGTGKTFVSAAAIVELVQLGKRVAASSNSHKAIDNVLLAVAERARSLKRQIKIVKKVSDATEEIDDAMVSMVTANKDARLDEGQVVGGTAWLFAREERCETFDYLFVDEAGQVSIANLIAMAGCAKNIVVVGDQMQLPQPIQGVHPGESGLSVLDYLMRGSRTIAPESGIFLPTSRRMHPSVCDLVSRLAYEGRLSSDEATKRQRLDGQPGLPPFGILFEEIDHRGNAQSSHEEADFIVTLYRKFVGAAFTDRQGRQRPMRIEDILVVSPYNAQVNLLTEKLPKGARVGTVDRFQGQEAPVCLVSMATSSAEEMPRDVGFLFSLNRLNVAISRAQALAVVVASPRLLDVPCSSLEDLKLVNALCALRAYARRQWR